MSKIVLYSLIFGGQIQRWSGATSIGVEQVQEEGVDVRRAVTSVDQGRRKALKIGCAAEHPAHPVSSTLILQIKSALTLF